ncbi:hypothetical protein [Clostridium botulinum]|uniref:hypothetical protein n=1 Tax=Clostridium botulinum TaxID=1491 RepID=UPI0003602E89|nr:hypothetical protein [Clostridium botulinum]
MKPQTQKQFKKSRSTIRSKSQLKTLNFDISKDEIREQLELEFNKSFKDFKTINYLKALRSYYEYENIEPVRKGNSIRLNKRY